MHDVLRVLHQRHAQRLAGGTLPPDGAHVALVIEGGGMRGVYLAGMLTALRDHDALPLFDSVHTCSVGAHLASYFLAGQIDVASSIFWGEALSSSFISLAHALVGKPVMDVAWIVHQVYCKAKRINFESLQTLASKLHIQCLSVPSATPVRFQVSGHMPHMPAILHATAAIPVLAGRPVSIGGQRFVDGGLYEPIPLESALSQRATHVLVLLTRKRDPADQKPSRLAYWLEKTVLKLLYGRPVSRAYKHSILKLDHVLAALQAEKTPTGTPVYGLFAPDDAPTLHRLEKSEAALRQAFQACRQATSQVLADVLPLS